MQAMKVLYQDNYVTVTQLYITIRKYYFPLATSKTIMFTDMRKLSLESALNVNHLWGTSSHFLNNWFNLDPQRKHKDKFLQIEVKNTRIRPSFTCEDTTKVFQILRNLFIQMDRKSVMFHSNRNKDTQLDQKQAHQMMKQQQQHEQQAKEMKQVPQPIKVSANNKPEQGKTNEQNEANGQNQAADVTETDLNPKKNDQKKIEEE